MTFKETWVFADKGGWLDEITDDPSNPEDYTLHPKRATLHCAGCGKFARWGGDEHYYNGNWDCYRYWTNCKDCGEVAVECV